MRRLVWTLVQVQPDRRQSERRSPIRLSILRGSLAWIHSLQRAPPVQLVELKRNAVRAEQGDDVVELGKPVAALAIRTDRQVGLAA
jgi:hypothetical protein